MYKILTNEAQNYVSRLGLRARMWNDRVLRKVFEIYGMKIVSYKGKACEYVDKYAHNKVIKFDFKPFEECRFIPGYGVVTMVCHQEIVLTMDNIQLSVNDGREVWTNLSAKLLMDPLLCRTLLNNGNALSPNIVSFFDALEVGVSFAIAQHVRKYLVIQQLLGLDIFSVFVGHYIGALLG